MTIYVSEVIKERGRHIIAVNDSPLRAEILRRDSRSWRWHVWHVWEAQTLGTGVMPSKRACWKPVYDCIAKHKAKP